MKNMKRIISMLLMLCMMAALMAVPAFAATTVTGLTITDPSGFESADGSYSIPKDYSGTLSFTSLLIGNELSALDGQSVTWIFNGQSFTKTITGGSTSITFNASEFSEGDNTLSVAYDSYIAFCDVYKPAASQAKEVLLDKKIATVEKGDTIGLTATVDGVKDNTLVSWMSTDPNVASVIAGTVEGKKAGEATIIVSDLDNGVEYARCVVTVTDSTVTDATVVSIAPIVDNLKKGQSINLRASVSGTGRFDHWYVADNMGSYVSIANTNSSNTTLKALSTTNIPVRLYAYSDDGASAYIEFTISASDTLQLEVSPATIFKGETASVYVVNPYGGEDFTWTITPSASYGVLATNGGYRTLGDSVELTAGPLEGRVTVTATSKTDSSRTATTTVYVNSEAEFGYSFINPAVASWSAGKGDLKFEVYPYFYKAYVDGKLLTPYSGYYTYAGGILTIKNSLLSTLSTGEHSLKVYTTSDGSIDGLVYATIYVSGTASNVYGDNAHVRGSSYNLYFTSTDPVSSVSINGTYVDPSNYTLDNNGRRLTLHANYLNKLGYGSYNMKLNTVNGYTENASFRIVTANYAPATGDDSNIGAWIFLMLVSAAGAVALIPRKKKSTDLIG